VCVEVCARGLAAPGVSCVGLAASTGWQGILAYPLLTKKQCKTQTGWQPGGGVLPSKVSKSQTARQRLASFIVLQFGKRKGGELT
jgi:hypothetical protein